MKQPLKDFLLEISMLEPSIHQAERIQSCRDHLQGQRLSHSHHAKTPNLMLRHALMDPGPYKCFSIFFNNQGQRPCEFGGTFCNLNPRRQQRLDTAEKGSSACLQHVGSPLQETPHFFFNFHFILFPPCPSFHSRFRLIVIK